MFPALKAGAVGYLLKHSAPEDVAACAPQARGARRSCTRRIARMVLQDLRRAAQAEPREPIDPLSERELEVLRLVARGMSNQEIADTLVVGEATVRSHVSAVLRKLQLASPNPGRALRPARGPGVARRRRDPPVGCPRSARRSRPRPLTRTSLKPDGPKRGAGGRSSGRWRSARCTQAGWWLVLSRSRPSMDGVGRSRWGVAWRWRSHRGRAAGHRWCCSRR